MIINTFSDVDECFTLQPCQNDGRCVDMYGTYRCDCKLGWMGKNCDIGNVKSYVLIKFVCFSNCL